MEMTDLKKEAQKAWFEYGEAIREAFGFTGDIVAGPLFRVTETNDEEQITNFTAYVKQQTLNLRNMRRHE